MWQLCLVDTIVESLTVVDPLTVESSNRRDLTQLQLGSIGAKHRRTAASSLRGQISNLTVTDEKSHDLTC